MPEPAEILSWDSDFFGFSIGRVRKTPLDLEGMRQVIASSSERGIRCLYLLARGDDAKTLIAAQAAGFRWVDLRITLDRAVRSESTVAAAEDPYVRPARASDLAQLRDIARRSHVDSRFYVDPHFPDDRCDDLFDRWITRSVEGRAQAVLVAESGGKTMGYTTCHLSKQRIGSIGLLGVAVPAQGLGTGRRLVDAAISWFERQGAIRVEVVTQGRNVAAQRLYQGRGFQTSAVGHWLHWWRDDEGEERP